MDTETNVANAVETVAENLPSNRTAIIVTATAITAVGVTLLAVKLKKKIEARVAAMREDSDTND
jgi:hypothetical protein